MTDYSEPFEFSSRKNTRTSPSTNTSLANNRWKIVSLCNTFISMTVLLIVFLHIITPSSHEYAPPEQPSIVRVYPTDEEWKVFANTLFAQHETKGTLAFHMEFILGSVVGRWMPYKITSFFMPSSTVTDFSVCCANGSELYCNAEGIFECKLDQDEGTVYCLVKNDDFKYSMCVMSYSLDNADG